MARLTIEDCVKQVPNRFDLIRLTTLRAKQLRRGARSLVSSTNGEIVTALREAAAGFVQPRHEEEPTPREASWKGAHEQQGGARRRQPSAKIPPRQLRSVLVSGADPSPLDIGAQQRLGEAELSLGDEEFFEEEDSSDLDDLLEDGGVY